MKPLRVLLVTSKFPRFADDPQPSFVYYFARELVKLGHEVAVVAPHASGAKKSDMLGGIRIHRFRYFIPSSMQKLSYGPGIPANIRKSLFAAAQMPFFILSQILLTKKVAKAMQPDIVHAHWGFPQGLAARFTGLPYMVTLYGGEMFLARKFHMVRALDYIIRGSCATVTVTDVYVKLLRDFGVKGKVGILPLGVDTWTFRPNLPGAAAVKRKFCKDGELMVLCVGRLVEKKGINYLVEAFADVAKSVPNSRLVIVGSGPMDSYLKDLARKLGIHSKVSFCGEISHKDLPKYYCAADLFVLPSIIDKHGDREGQGVVYLEAMASKVPVIGTNTGGIPDVITSRDVGLLVPEKNSRALAAAIIKLLQNRKLRERMGEKAYEHALRRFSWRHIAEEYVKMYRKCIKSI